MKPRLLDLFCGAGGATKGYQRAGFEVVGIDIDSQPNYCGDEFFQTDALAVLRSVIVGVEATCFHLEYRCLGHFDVVHASPPCQSYSKAFKHMATPQQQLVDVVREWFQRLDLPWVIENVEGAPVARQDTLEGGYGVELCGTQFGLKVRHHRLFETSFPVNPPSVTCQHSQQRP